MNVTVNDKPFTLPAASTLEDALTAAKVSPKGIATALNGAVIPAPMRAKTVLADGDKILVITAFYGG